MWTNSDYFRYMDLFKRFPFEVSWSVVSFIVGRATNPSPIGGHGVPSCRGESAGVAKRPRERSLTFTIRNNCIAAAHTLSLSMRPQQLRAGTHTHPSLRCAGGDACSLLSPPPGCSVSSCRTRRCRRVCGAAGASVLPLLASSLLPPPD